MIQPFVKLFYFSNIGKRSLQRLKTSFANIPLTLRKDFQHCQAVLIQNFIWFSRHIVPLFAFLRKKSAGRMM